MVRPAASFRSQEMSKKRKPRGGQPHAEEEDAGAIADLLMSLYRSGALTEVLKTHKTKAGAAVNKQPPPKVARPPAVEEEANNSAPGQGWILQKPKKQSRATGDAPKDKVEAPAMRLSQAGWSVSVVESAKIPTCVAGVALVSCTREGEELAAKCANAKSPLALVSQEPLTNAASTQGPYWVEVREGELGRVAVKRLYVNHLGVSATRVAFKAATQKVRIPTDTVLFDIECFKDHMSAEGWKKVSDEDPKEFVKGWLKEHAQGTQAVDIFRPAIPTYNLGMVRVKARIQLAHYEAVKNASGLEGVSTWPVRKVGEEPDTKPVWLPWGTTRPEAFAKADQLGGCGSVVLRRDAGVGVRVPTKDFAQACEILLGREEAAKRIGGQYEIRGLPLAWGRTAVESVLAAIKWEATPERPKYDGSQGTLTRSWIVRSVNTPAVLTIEHDPDLQPAVINKVEEWRRPSPKGGGKGVYLWKSQKAGKGKGASAGRAAREPPAPPAPAARPAAARPAVAAGVSGFRQGQPLRTGWTGPGEHTVEGASAGGAQEADDANMGSDGSEYSGHEELSDDEFLADLAPADPQSRVMNQLATQVANLASMMQALQLQMQDLQRGAIAPLTPPTPAAPPAPVDQPRMPPPVPVHHQAPPIQLPPEPVAPVHCRQREERGRAKSSSPTRQRGREGRERSPRPNPGQLEF